MDASLGGLKLQQKAAIAAYRCKWEKIALSNHAIDESAAAAAVNKLYAIVGLPPPEIMFFSSPKAAVEFLGNRYLNSHLTNPQITDLCNPQRISEFYYWDSAAWQGRINADGTWIARDWQRSIELQLSLSEIAEISQSLHIRAWETIDFPIWHYLGTQMECSYFGSRKLRSFWSTDLARYDFYLSELGNTGDRHPWQAYIEVAQTCGWIFPTPNLCAVCDRPANIRLDSEGRLHARKKPAIRFTDDFSIYAYHGTILPAEYGQISPRQWSVQWVLNEQNVELRAALIKGIGYRRLCRELGAIKLDDWREYSLLRLFINIDVEPVYLLKMVCPSTKKTHVLRVPPHVQSAKDAIAWVNWGCDPESFAAET